MARMVRPPRVVVTRFLQGRIVGPPNREELQLRVVREALGFIDSATEENWLLKLPFTWSEAVN